MNRSWIKSSALLLMCAALVTVMWTLLVTVLFAAIPAFANAPGAPASTGGPPPVHVLAIARLETSGLENPDPARDRFERLLVQQLQAAGFHVILSSEFEPVRRALADSIGMSPDPGGADSSGCDALSRPASLLWVSTGERGKTSSDPVAGGKSDAARSADFSKLDGRSESAIMVDMLRTAASRREKEVSDAAKRIACERLGAGAVVEARLARGVRVSDKGKMEFRAQDYSLQVSVIRADGVNLHEGASTIEAATKAKFTTVYSPGFGKYSIGHTMSFYDGQEPIKRKKLFKNEKRNLHAVRFALTPFAADEPAKGK